MAKRKLFEEGVVELCGYLHDLSDVQTSQTGTTKYFTAHFQTSKSEVKRLVSFSPEKHRIFVQAGDSPIKLKNPVLKPGRQGNTEVFVNRYTDLEVCSQPLTFMKSSELPTTREAPHLKVEDLDKEDLSGTVVVKVIGFICETKVVRTRYGEKETKTAIVADSTGSIKLTLWQKSINQVQTNNSYKITNIITKNYDGSLCINTTSDTTISEVSPLVDVKTEVRELLADNTSKVEIHQINISQIFKCSNSTCNKIISPEGTDSTVRCETCKMKQNKKRLNKITVAKLLVKVLPTNEMRTFRIYEKALEDFITGKNKTDLLSDLDRLEDYMLELEHVYISHGCNSNIVTRMTTTVAAQENKKEDENQNVVNKHKVFSHGSNSNIVTRMTTTVRAEENKEEDENQNVVNKDKAFN